MVSVAARVSPPVIATEYVFDYSRSGKQMRFRLDEETWTVGRMVGQWDMRGQDPATGRWTVYCLLLIKGDTAYVSVPGSTKAFSRGGVACSVENNTHDHSQCQAGVADPFPQGRDTHWRLCYAREMAEQGHPTPWRLRDERRGELWFVGGYRGLCNVNYMDHGSHVFVDGPVTVDGEGIAHFE